MPLITELPSSLFAKRNAWWPSTPLAKNPLRVLWFAGDSLSSNCIFDLNTQEVLHCAIHRVRTGSWKTLTRVQFYWMDPAYEQRIIDFNNGQGAGKHIWPRVQMEDWSSLLVLANTIMVPGK